MRKVITMLLIMISCLGLNPVNVYAARTVLSVPGLPQEGTNWCWAASSRMLALYSQGSCESQQWIVSNYAEKANESGNYDMREADNFLTYKSYGQYCAPYSIISYTRLQSVIRSNGKPIFCVLENGGGMAYLHAVVMRGYDTSNSSVLYIDPSDGLGHLLSYSRFCDGIKFDGSFSRWSGFIY